MDASFLGNLAAGGTPISVEEVARRMCITPKSAAAKIRRYDGEFKRQRTDGDRDRDAPPPEGGPWHADLIEQQCVYVVTGKEAMFELEVDDPSLILLVPDLDLLEARKILGTKVAAGYTGPAHIDNYAFDDQDERWNRALAQAYADEGIEVRQAGFEESMRRLQEGSEALKRELIARWETGPPAGTSQRVRSQSPTNSSTRRSP